MDFFHFVIITIQITTTMARKYASSSESIENLVYFKDCQHKNELTTTTTTEQALRESAPQTLRQPDCPFPKMCCALSCGNDCDGNKQARSFAERQLEPIYQGMPADHPRPPLKPHMPIQPQLPRNKRKRLKMPMKMQPIPSRRAMGFTKDKIKSLIAHDDDIKRILKDLVRVTMQKVDLVEIIQNKGGNIPTLPISDEEE